MPLATAGLTLCLPGQPMRRAGIQCLVNKPFTSRVGGWGAAAPTHRGFQRENESEEDRRIEELRQD